MMAYVLLRAGFLTLGDSNGADAAATATEPGYVAGAVMAGFSWEWITSKINQKMSQ